MLLFFSSTLEFVMLNRSNQWLLFDKFGCV